MIPPKFSLLTAAAATLLAVAPAVRAGNARKSGGAKPAAVSVVSLESAIGRVLTDNPDARIAAARIAGAQGMLVQAESAARPQLSAHSSYMRTNQPVSVFGTALNQRSFSQDLNFNSVPDADNWNSALSVSVPLYTGGKTTASRQAAGAAVEAGIHNASAVRQALAFESTRAFITIHKSRDFIRAAEAAAGAFESNLALSRQRLAAGTALKTDALDMEVGLAQAREDVARSRNANALARQALAELLGMESGAVEVTDSIPPLPVPSSAQVPLRAELQAAGSIVRAAEARVREVAAGARPSVHAFGQVEHNRGTEFDGDGSNYTLGIRAQWNLWDGGRTRGQIQEAEAALTAAQETERRQRLAVNTEVQRAKFALQEAEERLKVSATSVDLAAESVKITRQRFEGGLALSTQLIDAETALTASRLRRAEAEADRRLAVAALRRALGLPMISLSTK